MNKENISIIVYTYIFTEFTEDQDKEKDKGLPGSLWPSGEEDESREKKEEKTPVSSSRVLFRFSSPIGSFTE